MKKRNGEWGIVDHTQFKFALLRLGPRRDILRRTAIFLTKRPDLSWVLSAYFKKFPKDREASDHLLQALQRDPTYDAAAANYIDAMDSCEPDSENTKYRRVIETANRRSEEKTIVLRIASLTFRGKRRSPNDAVKLIEGEKDPTVKGILLHRLFGAAPHAPFQKSVCKPVLEEATKALAPDLARFCAAMLLDEWPWTPPKSVNRSVALLMIGLGLRKRGPTKRGVLDQFFEDRFKIGVKIPWRTALKKDWRETERRCLKLQQTHDR
jgi:hypothetical protein